MTIPPDALRDPDGRPIFDAGQGCFAREQVYCEACDDPLFKSEAVVKYDAEDGDLYFHPKCAPKENP